VDQRRVMTCLVLQFIAQAKAQEGLGEAADRSRANDFIEWGCRISALMGKYAYRLILELIYTNLLTALDQNNSFTDEISGMNAELELGSFRTFSGSHRSVGVANRKAARSKYALPACYSVEPMSLLHALYNLFIYLCMHCIIYLSIYVCTVSSIYLSMYALYHLQYLSMYACTVSSTIFIHLCMHVLYHLFIHLCMHCIIYLFIYACTCTIFLSTLYHIFIHVCMHCIIYLSMFPCTVSSIYPSMFVCTVSSIHPSMYVCTVSSIYPSMYVCTVSSIYPCIQELYNLFIHLCMHCIIYLSMYSRTV